MNKINKPKIEIHLLNIDDIDMSDDGVRSVIAPFYIRKAEAIKSINGQKAEIGAGYLLFKYLGVKTDEDLKHNEYGKPSLKARGEMTEFSLSHSGKYVVLAVSDIPIGVDIESRENITLSVLRRVLPDKHYKKLVEKDYSGEVILDKNGKITPCREEKLMYTKKWTSVEAVLKAIGKGFYLDPSMEESFMDGWNLFSLQADDEYVISVAIGR